MTKTKEKNPPERGDVLEYVRERAAKDPALAAKIDEEFCWLQLVRRIQSLLKNHHGCC